MSGACKRRVQKLMPGWSGRGLAPAVAHRPPCREDCNMRATTRMLVLSVCLWSMAAATAPTTAATPTAARRRDYEPYMFAAVPLHAPVPVLRVLSPAPLAVPAGRLAPRAAPPPRPYASPVQLTPFTRPYDQPRTSYADRAPYADTRPYADRALYADRAPYVDSRTYPDRGSYAESRPYADVRPYADSYSESHIYSEPRPYTEARSQESRPYESRPYSEPRPHGSRPYVEAVEYYDQSAAAPASFGRAPPRPSSGEYALEWDGLVLASAEEPASQEAPVLYARPSTSGGYTYRKLSKKPPKKAASSKEQPVIVKIHKHKIIKS